MEWDPVHPPEVNQGNLPCHDGWRLITERDQMGWAKIGGMLGEAPFSPADFTDTRV